MDEALYFKFLRSFCPESCNIIKGKLPRRDNSRCPHIVPFVRRSIICDSCLGRNMDINIGRVFFGERHNAEVGNDEGVNACFGGLHKKIRESVYLVISRHGVAGLVDLNAPFMCGVYRRLKLLCGKIGRCGSHGKCRTAEIDRICAEIEGTLKSFHISCRREKLRKSCFNFTHNPLSPLSCSP